MSRQLRFVKSQDSRSRLRRSPPRLSPRGTLGVGEGFTLCSSARLPVVVGPTPLVNNLFRTETLTRWVSTKSTPSAVSVNSALSAFKMYPFLYRYQMVN